MGALTYAQMHLVSQAALVAGVQVRFVIIGWARDGALNADPSIVDVCQVNTKRLLGLDRRLGRSLAQCDLVLDIGEGDSFSDIYGWKRLVFLIGTKLRAAGGGRKLVLSPQTLGPFKHPVAAWLADLAMRRASLVCARDGMSTAYFESRGLGTPFLEAIDVAFALPFDRLPRPDNALRVGINVSGLLWAGGYSGANQFGLALDYRETTLALVRHFSALPGVRVVLVPHVVNADRLAEDDLRASQEIADSHPGVEVAGPFATPMQAKSFIAGFDFFMGARMHACIAAFSTGVPCVPLAYSRKFTGLFDSLGYAHVADCTRDDQATVLLRVTQAFEQRGQLAAEVARGRREAQVRLDKYNAALQALLRDNASHG
ncbi:MAG: polysaccharide pyruvyl transferase family protein [Burkholderiaceae bacterium]|nr:polysaccharide pyruvyl transferase family protein [Burkholderiaceae bacterium]